MVQVTWNVPAVFQAGVVHESPAWKVWPLEPPRSAAPCSVAAEPFCPMTRMCSVPLVLSSINVIVPPFEMVIEVSQKVFDVIVTCVASQLLPPFDVLPLLLLPPQAASRMEQRTPTSATSASFFKVHHLYLGM